MTEQSRTKKRKSPVHGDNANGQGLINNLADEYHTTFRPITLAVAEGITQDAHNKIYSKQYVISSVEALQEATRFDHVAGVFKNSERSVRNFISADCLIMDCDNTHSDNPEHYLTPELLAQRLPNVEFYICYSRNHMKAKGNHPPAPRGHFYFPLSAPVLKASRIRELKECLLALIPEFDKGAKDAARFLYGVEHPHCEHYEGALCIDEYLAINGITADTPDSEHGEDTANNAGFAHQQKGSQNADGEHGHTAQQDTEIPKGERNPTLFHIALSLLSRYDTAKARELFDKACLQCTEPLSVQEVNGIWKSALRYAKDFKTKYTAKKQPLTVNIIEQCLERYSISVRWNNITKAFEVSDMPHDESIPDQYHAQPELQRKAQNANLLPLFLAPKLITEYNCTFRDNSLKSGIAQIAHMHQFNPVVEMLNATQWDGQNRVAVLFEKLGLYNWDGDGPSGGDYMALVQKWLHQAISLLFNDGSLSPDLVLVLQGPQGIGKTNFFRALAVRPEWFTEGATINMQDKDTVIRATSTWITELGELDATLRKEQSDLKSFLTDSFDKYRRPYAEKDTREPRRTTFCATVNPQEVNRDPTGSRRFLFIPVDSLDKDFIYQTMTPDWCAQLWRQVYDELYLKLGPKGYHLTDDEIAFIERNNAPFRVQSPVEGILRDLIDWDKVSDQTFKDYADYTAAEVKLRLDPLTRNYSGEQIAEALKRLCAKYGANVDNNGYSEVKYTAKKVIVKGKRKYRLPRIKQPDATCVGTNCDITDGDAL